MGRAWGRNSECGRGFTEVRSALRTFVPLRIMQKRAAVLSTGVRKTTGAGSHAGPVSAMAHDHWLIFETYDPRE